ncbi:transketolase C-terminal domain-containing protein [Malikia sp.]|uniref:transketolase family protein n=1 Tax=Malikia sp. TaxID=2070706 RepID=UPI00261EA68B|nr:transketolase C-terminal domain-containing protein [Malikia sp.]MDD2727794.1 transketolase C-terminal domain-containing protein [Malikia sp.]
MRDAFSNTLVRLALADPKVLLLTGDHGYALFDEFRKRCPDQYINAGIAEQNMVGMAAGLARVGFRPFVYGLAAFVPIRTVEQIKLDIAHDDLPVVLLGDGAGFVYSHLGTSHQSTEDIACTRAIPGLQVLSPADRYEMTACMEYAYATKGPVYLRMGKSDRGDVHAGPIDITQGNLLQVREGRPGCVAFVATGSMVKTAVQVADTHFAEASVWSVPSIKPVNAAGIARICSNSAAVVTMEEHTTAGGLGSLVAEIAAEQAPVRMLRIGVPDRFSEHCGTYEYLLCEHGLDAVAVQTKVQAFLNTMLSR